MVLEKAVPRGRTSTWSLTCWPASGSLTVPLKTTVVSGVEPPTGRAVVPSARYWLRAAGGGGAAPPGGGGGVPPAGCWWGGGGGVGGWLAGPQPTATTLKLSARS